MKIASFSFFAHPNKIAGDQVPAIAFWEWCEQLGVECDIVTNVHNPHGHVPWKIIVDPAELNEYDAVFFSTLGFFTFDFTAVTVPYTVMLHGEFDQIMYGGANWANSVLKRAKFTVAVDDTYWDTAGGDVIPWYPCTLPRYLLTDTDVEQFTRREGLMYSARLASCKQWDKLANLSNDDPFRKSVSNRIDVYGQASKKSTLEKIREIQPRWHMVDPTGYNVFDYDEIAERNRKYQYVWDVFWNTKHTIRMNRLNLSAVEAIKFGCVPIVDNRTVPLSLLRFRVPTISDIYKKPSVLRDYHPDFGKYLMEYMLDKNIYTYSSVRKQVTNIINRLTS